MLTYVVPDNLMKNKKGGCPIPVETARSYAECSRILWIFIITGFVSDFNFWIMEIRPLKHLKINKLINAKKDNLKLIFFSYVLKIRRVKGNWIKQIKY
ncbi:hypothetical protein WQ54_31255 [Bacillus sp. SA1-12]|nr:hypothetical protein WQ54_31255 [Bacillus sp. SA1-12]